ncbi:hypothetical protein SALBM311S_12481 [Streptomyces alboniger]
MPGGPAKDSHGAYSAATTSFATRSPDRTAPSMKPIQWVEVSVPAQWIPPTGARRAGPYWVRTPGAAMETGPPRV